MKNKSESSNSKAMKNRRAQDQLNSDAENRNADSSQRNKSGYRADNRAQNSNYRDGNFSDRSC